MTSDITITRYKHTRNWAIWKGYELLAVTVYKRGAAAVKNLIDKLMNEKDHIDIQLGDIIEVAGSRGHVVGLPEQYNEQRFALVHFFSGKAATARGAVSVLLNENVRVVVERAKFDNMGGAA